MLKDVQFFGVRMPEKFKSEILDFVKKRQKIDMDFTVSKLIRDAIKLYMNHS